MPKLSVSERNYLFDIIREYDALLRADPITVAGILSIKSSLEEWCALYEGRMSGSDRYRMAIRLLGDAAQCLTDRPKLKSGLISILLSAGFELNALFVEPEGKEPAKVVMHTTKVRRVAKHTRDKAAVLKTEEPDWDKIYGKIVGPEWPT